MVAETIIATVSMKKVFLMKLLFTFGNMNLLEKNAGKKLPETWRNLLLGITKARFNNYGWLFEPP